VSTGIYHRNPIGEIEEVDQESIDAWCRACQISYRSVIHRGARKIHWFRCQGKGLIQRCWDESESSAHKWHLQHECPFIAMGVSCRCNDFPNIREAFKAAGVEYREEKKEANHGSSTKKPL